MTSGLCQIYQTLRATAQNSLFSGALPLVSRPQNHTCFQTIRKCLQSCTFFVMSMHLFQFLTKVLTLIFYFPFHSIIKQKKQKISFHSGLHTFLGSLINCSGSTMVVQSKGSINRPVCSFQATRTPKFYEAVVRQIPLNESPRLMTLAFTMSLGLKHSIMTTESIIFSLTFSFRMAPSRTLPSRPMHGTQLTCRISIMHSYSLTLSTLPYTRSPTAKPILLLGKQLVMLQMGLLLMLTACTVPNTEQQMQLSRMQSPYPRDYPLYLHSFWPGEAFLLIWSCIWLGQYFNQQKQIKIASQSILVGPLVVCNVVLPPNFGFFDSFLLFPIFALSTLFFYMSSMILQNGRLLEIGQWLFTILNASSQRILLLGFIKQGQAAEIQQQSGHFGTKTVQFSYLPEFGVQIYNNFKLTNLLVEVTILLDPISLQLCCLSHNFIYFTLLFFDKVTSSIQICPQTKDLAIKFGC